MNYLKKIRTMRSLISLLSGFVAMCIAGCEGGMIGTGTGPSTETYTLTNLPERVSPDIPKTLLRGEELSPSESGSLDVLQVENYISPRMDEFNSGKAEGWRQINGELVFASLMRVSVEINSTIIDMAFDDILNTCADQLLGCTIPADQIKVKLTQDVINRFIAIVTDLVESLPPYYWTEDQNVDGVSLVKEQFTSLLNSNVVLGETHYSQLDGAPYSHSVQTFLKRQAASDERFTVLLWHDEEFHVRWHNDRNVANYIFDATGVNTAGYFYQNNTPSELVTISGVTKDDQGRRFYESHSRLIATDPKNAGVLVELAYVTVAGVTVNGEFSITEKNGFIQGNMNDGGGYAIYDDITFHMADTPRAVDYTGFRESFDNVGDVIAVTECQVSDFTQGIEVCDEEEFEPSGSMQSLITDSPYYFQSGEFDSLTATHDVIRWKVEGLPVETRRFVVVSADSAIEPTERELLCWGAQFVSGDSRIFCPATDEQLSNTVVLELVEGKPAGIIPTANLEQIQ